MAELKGGTSVVPVSQLQKYFVHMALAYVSYTHDVHMCQGCKSVAILPEVAKSILHWR